MEVDSFLYKPLTAKAIQAALRETAPTARSLLIVDDDPSAVRLIERMVYMAEEPYRIFRAYSTKEALARIRAQPPDAVVLDLVMPDDDGFSLISTLHHDPATAHIPIIVVSGYATEKPQRIGPIGIVNRAGFTPTETLHYLQAILSAVPPAPVERYTIAPPLSAEHPV
jgi:CheY-like chemotaxis protein